MISIRKFLENNSLSGVEDLTKLTSAERSALLDRGGVGNEFLLRTLLEAADATNNQERDSDESCQLLMHSNDPATSTASFDEAGHLSIPLDSLLLVDSSDNITGSGHEEDPQQSREEEEEDVRNSRIESDILNKIYRRQARGEWAHVVEWSIDFHLRTIRFWYRDGAPRKITSEIRNMIFESYPHLQEFDFVELAEQPAKEIGKISIIHEWSLIHDTVLGVRCGCTLFSREIDVSCGTKNVIGTIACVVQRKARLGNLQYGILTAAHCAHRTVAVLQPIMLGAKQATMAMESVQIPVVRQLGSTVSDYPPPMFVDIAMLTFSNPPKIEQPNVFISVPFTGLDVDGNEYTETRSGRIREFCPDLLNTTVKKYRNRDIFVMGIRCCIGRLQEASHDLDSLCKIFKCSFPSIVDSGDSGAAVLVESRTSDEYILLGILSKKITRSQAQPEFAPSSAEEGVPASGEKGQSAHERREHEQDLLSGAGQAPQDVHHSRDLEQAHSSATTPTTTTPQVLKIHASDENDEEQRPLLKPSLPGVNVASESSNFKMKFSSGAFWSKKPIVMNEYHVSPIQYVDTAIQLFNQ